MLGVCTRQIAVNNRLPDCTYTGSNALLKKWVESRAVDLNLLASDGSGIEDWAAQKYTLDISENPSDLLKKKGAAVVYSDLYSAYDKNVSGIQHEKKSSRRLLIDVFQQGLRPIKHEIRTYMISTEDMDEAHFLVHPKKRNCRYCSAREYGWTNH